MTIFPRSPFPTLPAAFLVVLLCLILSPTLGAPAQAAGLGQDFNKAYNAFHALKENRDKAKFRSEWVKVERQFKALYDRDKKGEYAPKSLYYLGRIQEELGYRSGSKSDFEGAVDYYQRTVKEFPDHDWADDCLYRSAELRFERLNQPEAAHRDLLAIVKDHRTGDMYPDAKAWLDQLDASALEKGYADEGNVGASITPTEGAAHLEMVRYKSSDEYTRVVLELDKPVQYVYKFLDPLPDKDKSYRVYVDLRGAVIGNEVLKNVKISDGILTGYRVGQNTPDTTRVVLDLLEHQEHKIFYLENPFRIIIDVYSPESPALTKVDQDTGKPVADGGKAPAMSSDPTGDLIEQLGLTVKTIMIDAGHGGHDNGAVYAGTKEKDLNLKIAKYLGDILKEQGFKVLYTRSTDEFVSLEDRTAMANLKKADMFISLHCNAHKNARIHGLEVYSLNMAKTEDAKRVAAKENAVDPKQISDLQYILSDLMLSSKIEESSDLAEIVQGSVIKHVRTQYNLNDHGHREAPFYVLMGAKMPSVLIELGYMTNDAEMTMLKKDSYLKLLAQGIAKGVAAYKKQIERFAQL